MFRILLADDDTDDTELFREAVTEVDPDVICDIVFDGSDILKRLSDDNYPTPNIIILDMNMPNVNGWATLKSIREDNRYSELRFSFIPRHPLTVTGKSQQAWEQMAFLPNQKDLNLSKNW